MNHRDTEAQRKTESFGLRDAATPRDPLTKRVIGAAIEVHRHLGPGLLESAYEECLYWELGQAALAVRRQVPLPVLYKEVKLDAGYRLDLVVEGQLIVELKTVDKASTDSRSPTTDLSEAQRDENWLAAKLQFYSAEGRY